jgi:hypothetical protein
MGRVIGWLVGLVLIILTLAAIALATLIASSIFIVSSEQFGLIEWGWVADPDDPPVMCDRSN